jgi:hypothetical protein
MVIKDKGTWKPAEGRKSILTGLLVIGLSSEEFAWSNPNSIPILLLLLLLLILILIHKLRVFENMVLRRIFGPKRDEVTGGWRKLHNEEIHDLYSSPSILRIIELRRMKWVGHVARMGEKRNAYRSLLGKPEGKSH